jgi:hypothetical protein
MQPMVRAFALALLLAPCALARADSYDLGSFRLALIDDPVRVEFQKGAAAPTLDNLQQVIRIAAATRGWKVATQAVGRMELINVVRDHTMSVELAYDETGYRLRYLQSTNLLYAAKGGNLRVIHKNYNEWLNELVLAINGGLQLPAQTSKGFAPVAKIDAVPYVSEKGRGAYQEFLGMPTPRAFAIAPNGSWGRAVRLRPGARGDVAEDALERCNRRGEGQCRVYAIDGHVVWTAASDR